MFDLSGLRGGAFSWNVALSLANASRLAYDNSGTIENIVLRSWGFSHHTIIDVGDTQGFIATADGVTLVAFRGTESLGDWIGNLDLAFATRPYGRVHRGFLDGFEQVQTVVASEVAEAVAVGHQLWFTGHSLGGALAIIAATEFAPQKVAAGVHTFGQPRFSDAVAASHIASKLGERYVRFVNDDDIVARLPPGFEHSGRLVHFDGDGQVRHSASESGVHANGPHPLAHEEFTLLQKEIKTIQHQLIQHGRSPTEGTLDRSVEGLFPGFGDHQLGRYIAILAGLADAIAPRAAVEFAKARSAAPQSRTAMTESSASSDSLEHVQAPVLLRLKSPAWTPPPDLMVGTKLGSIVTGVATLDVVRALEADPNVVSVEVETQRVRRDLTQSTTFVGATTVHRPPLDERGDSALIGIIDDGIDVLHEAFTTSQGASRILAVWDQADATGPSPHTLDPIAFPAGGPGATGTVYLANSIADFIGGQRPVPRALRNPDRHGTHVASIAAGRGLPVAVAAVPDGQPASVALADGMAPDAKLIVVIPKLTPTPGDPWSIGYSNGHLAALKFLVWARSGGNPIVAQPLPMVINVSMGMNAGAHDGMSKLERAFDTITDKGNEPGLVIVKSAGNERGHGGHARVQMFNGELPIVWTALDHMRFRDYFEAWYSSRDSVEFTLVDPAGRRSRTVSGGLGHVLDELGGNLCELTLTENHPENTDSCLVVTITSKTMPIQPGPWTLIARGVAIQTTHGIIDIWAERDDGTRAVRFDLDTHEGTLSIPGTADTVITVAAANSREPLALTSSSSWGPTRSGKTAKPELCAPGTAIVAASAGGTDHRATRAETGTSMAAPHVAGALALVMSHRHKQPGKKQFNAQQLRGFLTQTVRNRTAFAHPGLGYGALDAAKLFALSKTK